MATIPPTRSRFEQDAYEVRTYLPPLAPLLTGLAATVTSAAQAFIQGDPETRAPSLANRAREILWGSGAVHDRPSPAASATPAASMDPPTVDPRDAQILTLQQQLANLRASYDQLRAQFASLSLAHQACGPQGAQRPADPENEHAKLSAEQETIKDLQGQGQVLQEQIATLHQELQESETQKQAQHAQAASVQQELEDLCRSCGFEPPKPRTPGSRATVSTEAGDDEVLDVGNTEDASDTGQGSILVAALKKHIKTLQAQVQTLQDALAAQQNAHQDTQGTAAALEQLNSERQALADEKAQFDRHIVVHDQRVADRAKAEEREKIALAEGYTQEQAAEFRDGTKAFSNLQEFHAEHERLQAIVREQDTTNVTLTRVQTELTEAIAANRNNAQTALDLEAARTAQSTAEQVAAALSAELNTLKQAHSQEATAARDKAIAEQGMLKLSEADLTQAIDDSITNAKDRATLKRALLGNGSSSSSAAGNGIVRPRASSAGAANSSPQT